MDCTAYHMGFRTDGQPLQESSRILSKPSSADLLGIEPPPTRAVIGAKSPRREGDHSLKGTRTITQQHLQSGRKQSYGHEQTLWNAISLKQNNGTVHGHAQARNGLFGETERSF
jgi:hypothetical protein